MRVVFKYAFDAGLIERPIRYGPTFRRPNAKTLRKARHSKGPRMFEARHIRRVLKGAGLQLRAMIYLAINCGLGNNDCATLPFTALDLKNSWLDFPRPKTGMPRRCPLWPETVEALEAAIAERPNPKDGAHSGLVFITKQRGTWAKDTSDNPISKEMTKLLKSLSLHCARSWILRAEAHVRDAWRRVEGPGCRRCNHGTRTPRQRHERRLPRAHQR